MNLNRSSVVLRVRSVLEILDLAILFCVRHVRLYAKLAAWTLLPVFLGCLALRYLRHSSWWVVWAVAFGAGLVLQGVFTVAASRVLFEPGVRARTVQAQFWRRSPVYLVGVVLHVAVLAVAAAVILPFSSLLGRLAFGREMMLLERSGPLAAVERGDRLARRQIGSAVGLWFAVHAGLVTAVILGELVGDAVLGTVMQLGRPFGSMWTDGGSPWALGAYLLMLPYLASARFLKYIDIRTRNEGWDVQLKLSVFQRAARAAGLVLCLLLASGSAAAAELAVNEDEAESARTELAKDAYRFCHDPQYPLDFPEARWCKSFASPSERCPAFPAVCRSPLGDEPWDSRRDSKAGGNSVVGAAASWLFWMLIAAAVAAAVWAAVRFTVGRSRQDNDEAGGEEGDHDDDDDDGHRREAGGQPVPVDSDAQRLMTAARAAAGQGRHARAIELAHAALVRTLEHRGLVRVHPSRTNGDHLRDLLPHPALRQEVRRIVRDVEGVQFGGREPSAQLSADVLQQVQQMVARNFKAVLLLALALTVTGACRGSHGSSEHGPLGNAGVVSFLHRRGFDARLRLSPLQKLTSHDLQLIVLPDAPVQDNASVELLRRWVTERGTLVLAGNMPAAFGRWLGHSAVPCRSRTTTVKVSSAAGANMQELRVQTPGRSCLKPVPAAESQTTPRTSVIAEIGDEPYALSLEYPDGGEVILVADHLLFTNAALAVADDAAFVARLLARNNARRVELVTRLTGTAPNTPLEAIGRGKLAPFMAQLMAFLGLLLLWRGTAFGKPRDAQASSRRAFSEHVRALGALYARAHAARHALAVVSPWVFDRLRERLHLRDRRGIGALAEALSARTGKPLGEVARVLAEAYDVSDSPSSTTATRATGTRAVVHEQDLQTTRQLLELLDSTRKRTMGGPR